MIRNIARLVVYICQRHQPELSILEGKDHENKQTATRCVGRKGFRQELQLEK